jgi:hypothetical protein
MNRSRPMTFHFLLMVLWCLTLCVSNNSQAQVQVRAGQGDCSEDAPCTAIAHQQEANTAQLDTVFGAGQVAIVSTAGMAGLEDQAAAVKNEPYEAQAVTEMKQTLADGSHIVQTTTATVARDSDGRTVRVQKLGPMGPWKSAESSKRTDRFNGGLENLGGSSGNTQTLTTIFDPVAKEHIDYTSDSKIAHVLLMSALPPSSRLGTVVGAEGGFSVSGPGPTGGAENGLTVAGPGPVGAVVQGFAVQARPLSPQASRGMEAKTESLGTKTIEGVQVTGTRNTQTIPTGTIGNDKDLNITRETWYSPELKLVIQSTQSDPRFGQTTYTLKNIQQGSPDVSLFRVPATYTIDKIVPRFFKTPAQ